MLAAKLQLAVPQHRAGQQAGFEQHLEAIADAEHRAAAGGKPFDFAHDRREAGHRSGPEIVAVREATRQDDDVGALEVRVLVPDVLGLLAEHLSGGVVRVLVAVGSGKDDDREFHAIDLDAITLDHRVREQLVGDLGRQRPGLGRLGRLEIELEVLALPHVIDGAVAKRVQRVGNRFSLRIEHGRLERDEHACTHTLTLALGARPSNAQRAPRSVFRLFRHAPSTQPAVSITGPPRSGGSRPPACEQRTPVRKCYRHA